MDDLSILNKPDFAGCLHCGRFIDISVKECTYCKSPVRMNDLRAAVARRKETIRRQSRINDRNALIDGVFSLAGCIVLAILSFAARLHWSTPRVRANLIDIGDHIWGFIHNNAAPLLTVFVCLPILAVVTMRWQRREK